MTDDIQFEDLHPLYQSIVNIIGLENTLKLGKEFGGEEIYFPKLEGSAFIENRNRKIIMEFKGHNKRELARKYRLTSKRVCQIVKSGKEIVVDTEI